jgi:putative ABC transport system permease protein
MFSDLLYRLRALFRRSSLEADLEDELRGHLEQHVEKYVRSGLPRAEALRRASLEFGGLDQMKERCRDARGVNFIETTIQDVRYGARMLRKNALFTVVAVGTLALGIGANTAIFGLLDSVMYRYLPVERPEELVQLMRLNPRRGNQPIFSFTNPIWEQVRAQQDVFSGTFAWGQARFDLARGGEVQYARGLWVSGDFFTTLGVRPAAGRLIAAGDDRRGCAGVAVLSYTFWQEHFQGAASAVGGTISLDNHSYPIIGVSAPGFHGVEVGTKFDVALPICATADFDGARARLDHRSWWWLHLMGRPKPEITPELLMARLGVLSPRIFAATVPNWSPDAQRDYLKWSLTALPAATGTSGLREQIGKPLGLLMAVVGAVLLIACGNITGLMLARSAARSREIAVRRALGASRSRLIRQLLTECLMLSAAGAIVGLLLATWGSTLLVRLISTARDRVFLDLSFNWRLLGFTAGVTIATGLVFGVLPALRYTRMSLAAAIKNSRAVERQRRRRLWPGQWVVASQIALSLVVLVAAGLLLRSFVKLVTLDIGFDRNDVLMMHAEPTTAGSAPAKWMVTWDEIERRLSSIPGVMSVSRTVMTPVSGAAWNQGLQADAPNAPAGDASLTYLNSVSPGYFKTLRIAVLAGRDFGAQDTPTAPRVAIINQTAARRFYPNLDPVGRFFRLGEEQGKLGEPIQIVGVVGDFKYESLREETYACAFFPIRQEPGFRGSDFMIRTSARPSAVLSLIRESVAEVDKSISLEFNTLARQVDDSLVQERMLATLSCFFGAMALLLATMGLYGAISYMVSQRQTEFGIRTALGATGQSILMLVLRDVAAILIAGLAAGAAVSLLSVQLLQKLLFGLAPRDAATILIAIGALSAVALIAGYIPARRAAKVDPNVALRYE